jgi:histidinol-phosphatase (PHP family)
MKQQNNTILIDCHIHSKKSHHGVGDLEDYVISALDKGIKTIAFTEHGPFIYDKEHRLSEGEIKKYFKDIDFLKRKYSGKINILSGLEMDFTPSGENYVRSFLQDIDCDLILGSVHFIETKKDRVKVWDYQELQNKEIQEAYFLSLYLAAKCKLFDSIAHPDLILRAGIDSDSIKTNFFHFINILKENSVAYEINCSGLSKPSYNPKQDKMVHNMKTFPFISAIEYAKSQGVNFTIGSDAHEPDKIGKNIQSFLSKYPVKNQIQYLT